MSPERLKKIQNVLNRRQEDLTIVMENVHKPQNMGAIVRTCDAVGIPTIHFISEIHKIGFLNSKAAGGCKKWVNVLSHKSVSEVYSDLRNKGFQILATSFSDDAINFRDIDYTIPSAIVVGGELEGLSPEASSTADHRIVIPMMGMTQSLNVSVATALILFEAQRQREEKGLYDKKSPQTPRTFPLDWGYPKLAGKFRNRNLPVPELDEEGNLLFATTLNS